MPSSLCATPPTLNINNDNTPVALCFNKYFFRCLGGAKFILLLFNAHFAAGLHCNNQVNKDQIKQTIVKQKMSWQVEIVQNDEAFICS